MGELLSIALESADDDAIPAPLDKRYHDLQAEIIHKLLRDADRPIFLTGKGLKDVISRIIPLLLDKENKEYLYERMDDTGLSQYVGYAYVDRFLALKPLMLTSNLPKNVNILLSDAIRSYLYGCNRAGVILCGALLEEILTTELEKIDRSLVYKSENGAGTYQYQMKVIINHSVERNVIDKKMKKDAKYVNKERNDAVHNCKHHNNGETVRIIEKTKRIMENIYERE